MPFTGSHPAAILPLVRLGLPASALVIGTMAPDLPYYLPTPTTAAHTHTLAGALGADVVLGLCAFLVWHLVLVPPLVWAAPEGLQRRIPDHLRTGSMQRLRTPGYLWRACLALAIGALTHVAWDEFTDAGTWGTRLFPWLETTMLGLAIHRWFHLAGSLGGLALLAWFLARWWRRAPTHGSADPIGPAVRWGMGLLLLGWAGWAAAHVAVTMLQAPGRFSRQALVVRSLVEFLSTVAISVIAAAVLWHVAQVVRAHRKRSTSAPS